MTKLINFKKGLLGTVAIAVLSTGTAFADGTAAETQVDNTFTLNYEVNGAEQPEIDNVSAPTRFIVDRIIDLTVENTSGIVTVAPGQEDAVTTFTLTNDGNGTQAYDLDLVNTGTIDNDDFDPTAPTSTITISYIPVGSTTPVTFDGSAGTFPVLAPDETITITVQQNIASGVPDTDLGNVILVANSFDETGATESTADTDGNDLLASENVLVDADGPAAAALDGDDDGAHSAIGTYLVAEADVTGVKTVSIFSEDGTDCGDIENGTPVPNSYSIPGACVEYRITVTNDDTREATAINVTDILPAELTFIAADIDGDFTVGSITTEPAFNADCSAVTCTVTYSGGTLAADDGTTAGNSPEGVVIIRALLQ